MAEKLPMHYSTLQNKSFIITGGASGLGLATATRFAPHGAYITLADLNEAEGNAAASSLTSQGYNVTFVHCDVTDWASSVRAFKHAINFSPRKTLDGAFLYAGIGGESGNLAVQVPRDNPEVSLDIDPIESSPHVLSVNLDGQLKSVKLALHYFRLPPAPDAPPVSPGKKPIFLVASLAGYIDYDPTHYCVSKYGVRGLFRSLRIVAKEPDSGFTVNLIAPGYTPTPLTTRYNAGEGSRQKAIEFVTANNLWSPVDFVVDAAALCATNTRNVEGDGGEVEVNGRSFGTWPHGWFDQMEDYDEGYGGMHLVGHGDKSGYRKYGFLK